MLNVDYTFPPFNWRIYGQLPDIFAADPYYQPRLREAFAKSPARAELFAKATYVFAEAAIWRHCSTECAIGFSTYAPLPRLMAIIAGIAWLAASDLDRADATYLLARAEAAESRRLREEFSDLGHARPP